VSYGRRYYTPAPTSIVTIPVGYADGLPRALSGNCDVLIDGLRHPVVGAVCMDETLVDIGGESVAAVGEEVILIGRSGSNSIDAWELARRAGTIPWEILTGISARVPRVAWTPSRTSDSTSGT
jgi:alanine racemase